MMSLNELLVQWRDLGPTRWAEHQYGWIMVSGKPIVLEPWQKAVLTTWWEHRDTTTNLVISSIKKSGKTTLNAILLAWRWLVAPGEHYSAANDQDQSVGRQFQMVKTMIKRHPLLRKHTKALAKRLIFGPTGSTIEALEVDPTGRSGSNHLTISHTECWGIQLEGAIRHYEELTPPPGLFYGLPALRICDSYAGFEAESETWHNLLDRGKAGESLGGDWPMFKAGALLLFHIEGEEARQRCFRGTAAEAEAYYDDQRASLRAGAFKRQHDNKRAASEAAFIDPEAWDMLIMPGYRCPVADRSIRLSIGLDLSTKHDHSGVVCVYRSNGLLHLGPYRVFKPRPVLDFQSVEDYLLELAQNFRISQVAYDPYQAEFLAQRLRKKGIKMVEFPQTVGNLTKAGNHLFDIIRQSSLVVYPGATDLRRYVLNAAARETSRGIRLVKSQASRKIALAIG